MGASGTMGQTFCGVCGQELRGADGKLLWREAAGLLGCKHEACSGCMFKHFYRRLPVISSCPVKGCKVRKCAEFVLKRATRGRGGLEAETSEIVQLGWGNSKPVEGKAPPDLGTWMLPQMLQDACTGKEGSDTFCFWVWDPLAGKAYSGALSQITTPTAKSRASLDRLYSLLHRNVVVPASEDKEQRASRPESLKAVYNIVKSDEGEMLRMMRFLASGGEGMPGAAYFNSTEKAKLAAGPWVAGQVLLQCRFPNKPFGLQRLLSRSLVVHSKSHVVVREILRSLFLCSSECTFFTDLTAVFEAAPKTALMEAVGPQDILLYLADNILWRRLQDFWQWTHHLYKRITPEQLRELTQFPGDKMGLMRATLWEKRRTLADLALTQELVNATSEASYEEIGKLRSVWWRKAGGAGCAQGAGGGNRPRLHLYAAERAGSK